MIQDVPGPANATERQTFWKQRRKNNPLKVSINSFIKGLDNSNQGEVVGSLIGPTKGGGDLGLTIFFWRCAFLCFSCVLGFCDISILRLAQIRVYSVGALLERDSVRCAGEFGRRGCLEVPSLHCCYLVFISCIPGCSWQSSGRSVRADASGAQATPTWDDSRLQLTTIEESHQYCSSVVGLTSISAHRHSGSNVPQTWKQSVYSSHPFWSASVQTLAFAEDPDAEHTDADIPAQHHLQHHHHHQNTLQHQPPT